MELSAFGRPTIPTVASFTGPGNDFDGVAIEIHTANLVGARFGKAQNLRRLKGQPGRVLQIGQNRCDTASCSIDTKDTAVFPPKEPSATYRFPEEGTSSGRVGSNAPNKRPS